MQPNALRLILFTESTTWGLETDQKKTGENYLNSYFQVGYKRRRVQTLQRREMIRKFYLSSPPELYVQGLLLSVQPGAAYTMRSTCIRAVCARAVDTFLSRPLSRLERVYMHTPPVSRTFSCRGRDF